MEDVFFEGQNGTKFKYRVSIIIKNKNKILIASDPWSNYWYLPGGKVNLSESINNAIKRELKEELDLDVKFIKKHWLVESSFFNEFNKKQYHELSIIASVIPKNKEIFEKQEIITNINGHKLTFKWININELNEINFHPKFLVSKLKRKLPENVEVFTDFN
ncbi:NUDIX domain-containing protein [Mycoplasmopsis felis]|uniref:NUDIX hydrolase n=1 Tax=Mycoplasmopsis felis TaxID=33923 RepID=UPI002AFF233D|nr:NUDIX domain-containing protein [Mycoplasmopsis felis]WQQ05374.1 NUDIX domain-containing protein [Mycoplasmopsis felis]